jgi:hypothetical protein
MGLFSRLLFEAALEEISELAGVLAAANVKSE